MSNRSLHGNNEPLNSSLGIGRVNTAHACGGLKSSPKAVLSYLALRYNEKRGYAWASINDMANACSMSPATVKRALRVLNDPKDGKNLITRSLRDDCVKKSRKTVIHWDKVAERATQFRPTIAHKPIPLSTEDAATIEAFSNVGDGTMEASFKSQQKDTLYDRLDEAVTLVRHHFRAHSTLQDNRNDGVVRACLHNCFDLAASGDKCLDVLRWICTAPANESIRKAVLGSGKLGGYIKGSFKDWMGKFEAPGEALSAPTIDPTRRGDEDVDRLLREGYGMVAYRQGGSAADLQAREHMLEQMATQVGEGNFRWSDRGQSGFWVDVAEHASVAYLLSQHCGFLVEPAQFQNIDCDESLRKLCVWAIEDDGWATDLAAASNPGDCFIQNLDGILEQYEEEG